MIIHRLTVRGWRRFRDEVTVSFDERLTVIYGPNESGKSTLIEALTRGLFDKHGVTGREMDSIRPWGSSLAPEVTVEFSAGNDRYRLRKRFLDSAESELRILVDDSWQLTADGDAADRRVLEFTGGKMPGRGVTRPHHRGLAEALWARQEDSEMPSEWNPHVLNRLESVLGDVLHTTTSGAIENLIRDRHLELLTQARGQPRVGGALHRAQEELARREEELARVRETRLDAERRMEDLADIQDEMESVGSRLREAEGELDEALRARKKAAEHREMRLQAKNTFGEAERKWEHLNRRVEGIKKARDDAEAAEKEMEGAAGSLATLEAGLRAAEEEVRQADEQLQEQRRKHRGLQETLDALNALRNLRITEAEISSCKRAAARAEELGAEIREAEKALTEEVFPTEEILGEARDLQEKIREGEAVLRTQGLTIGIEPVRELGVEVVLDGSTADSVTLEAGEVREFTAANETVLDLADVLRMTVRSGNELAARAVQDLRANEDALSDLLEGYGTSSVVELEERHSEQQTLELRIEELRSRLEDLPMDGDGAEIQRRLRELENRRRRLKSGIDAADLPGSWMEHSAAVLDELIEEHTAGRSGVEERISELEKKKVSAEEPTEGLREDISGVEQRLSALRQRMQDRLSEAEKLENEDEFSTEEERLSALRRAALEAQQARHAWEQLDEEKAEMEDAPEKTYASAARRKEQLQEGISRLQRLEAGHLEVLEAASASNVREREGDLEAEVEAVRSRVERLERDAGAYRLLDDLLGDHRRDRMLSLGGPVKEQVDRWMVRLLGGTYAGVEFSAELTPDTVRVRHPDVAASVSDDLSYGAREQLNFLVRLALGVILSEGERQVVVLDDRLTNTDHGRLGRARSILEEASEKSQIVLLTCFPEGYSGVEGEFIDMRSLVQG